MTFTVTASDSVDGSVSVSCTPAPRTSFALALSPYTTLFRSAHGNTASQSFTVTVRDTTPPVVTVPANLTAEATSAAGASLTEPATALETLDGNVSVTLTETSGTTFALGTTTVTCSSADAHAN